MWVLCCCGGRELHNPGEWAAGGITHRALGTPGHLLPVGLLEPSRDRHLHHIARRQPPCSPRFLGCRHSSVSSFAFEAVKAPTQPFASLHLSLPIDGSAATPDHTEGLNSPSERESRHLKSRLRFYLPVAEDSQYTPL